MKHEQFVYKNGIYYVTINSVAGILRGAGTSKQEARTEAYKLIGKRKP